MSYIRQLPTGKFQATVRIKKVKKYKTFACQKEAEAWANETETFIKKTLAMSDAERLNLSTAEAEALTDIFSQAGIDIIAFKNQHKLDAINLLSGKELDNLSTDQIKNLGGKELFAKAGKLDSINYLTFNEVCEEYLVDWSEVKKHKDYKNQQAKVIYWCSIFGQKIIKDISRREIKAHLKTMVAGGARLTTINRKKAVLSSVFKYALNEEHIDFNACSSINIGDDAKRRDRVLSDSERTRLLAACEASNWPRLYLLVLMAMSSGARKGELLKLRWCDVDFKENTALLLDTKNGANRVITLQTNVIAELKRFQEVGKGLIFPGLSPRTPKNIYTAWGKALELAEIAAVDVLDSDGDVVLEGFTFHCLRHSYCSALSDMGVNIQEIATLAGHRTMETTRRYVHTSHDKAREINDKLAAAMGV